MSATIQTGDCLEILRGTPDNEFTAIVTDPPYGLEFMGKGWDKVLPPVEVWRECLRVLKPGGHALIFGGTRTYHRLACAVEAAGFEVRDCLMWLYGQGFPKSLDVSKAIDKAAGVEGGRGELKRGGERLMAQAPGGERDGGGTWGDEKGRDPYTYVAGSEAARLWAGYGTALKPAWEPILLARKPLVGTVERNCREHGTGALNIDGCRILLNGDYKSKPNGRPSLTGLGDNYDSAAANQPDTLGRWPANLILDEEAAVILDAQAPNTGQAAPLKGRKSVKLGKNAYGDSAGDPEESCEPHDALGGASRFFYQAKSSKRDRNLCGDGESRDCGNNHATVKPVELMRWLVRLVKGPADNLILDPFAGSGTTGVAAQLEDVPFLLIEREPAYVEIIRRRLAEYDR